ncbi:MAG: oxidoreductase [Gammaproteobacteria bacterium BRH_c0]|nr:MAG: oxidoreductase [Gammaproteobacteria bacterium BRH_c0]
MNLAGKVAIVTGSSAGIGAAIARNLSEAGAKLVLTARREDRLKEMQASLPNESAILAADIGAPEAADQLLALAQERFGRADILVNNAGILSTNPIDLIDIELMAKMIQVNFEAVMRLSYTFGRAFKAQGEGAIINVSSIGGSLTVPTWGVYCAVKAAVETFSESLRIELGSSGVKVGIVAPGSTKTEIFEVQRAHGENPIEQEIDYLEAEDIARAVRFMLEQPNRANIARLHLYASAEIA